MSYGERGFSSEAGWGGSTAAERATERKYEKLYEDGIDPFKEFDSRKLLGLISSIMANLLGGGMIYP